MSVLNLSEQRQVSGNFAEEVLHHTGVNVRDCYQCGKCSAGCPIAFAMDTRPNRIIRMIQLGLKDEVLESRAIWLCGTCSTCTTRCPRGVDLCRLNDGLRVMSYKAGKTAKVQNEVAGHEEFMKSISSNGRIYELGYIIALKFRTKNFFQDVDLGWPMVSKGKMAFLPPKIKGAKDIRKIVENCARLEGGKA